MFFSVLFNTTNKKRFSQLSGHKVFENLLFGSTTLPPTLCGPTFMAASTSSTAAHVTNSKPLECLVFGCLSSAQSVSILRFPEWLLRFSSVVSELKPPMKSCLRSLGDSDSDTTTAGGETLTMLARWHPLTERCVFFFVFVRFSGFESHPHQLTLMKNYGLTGFHISKTHRI